MNRNPYIYIIIGPRHNMNITNILSVVIAVAI